MEWSECGKNFAFYTELRNENEHWQWDLEGGQSAYEVLKQKGYINLVIDVSVAYLIVSTFKIISRYI